MPEPPLTTGIQRIPRDQMRTQSRVEELSFAAACCVPSQEPAPAFKELNGWEYGESYKGELWDAVRTYTWGFFVLHERHRKGRSSRPQEASLGELQGQLGRAAAQTAAPAQTPGMGKAVVRAEVGEAAAGPGPGLLPLQWKVRPHVSLLSFHYIQIRMAVSCSFSFLFCGFHHSESSGPNCSGEP
nr:uncharacterized protein LOC112438366 [Pan paniscus]